MHPLFKTALAAGMLVSAPAAAADVGKPQEGDRTLGDAKAPVTIVEYQSFACQECAQFQSQILPVIQKEYVDKGKVRVIFRDFPINANSLHAALVASCVPEKEYPKAAKTLFDTQKSWAGEPAFLPGLKAAATQAGLKKDAFYTCLENKEAAGKIVSRAQAASQQFGVRNVPAFFVNGEKVERFASAEDVKTALESAVAGKSANAPFEAEMIRAAEAKADDIVIGKADAPVSILEYASLSCPHCAMFSKNVLPDVKKNLIDTGKAKLVFRHYPLNEPALKGAMLVECVDKAKRADALTTLFAEQEKWAFQPDFQAKLKEYAAKFGVKEKAFDTCMADKKLEEKVVASRADGTKIMNVQSTPSFFINGKKGEHLHDAGEFKQAVEAAGKTVSPAR